MSSGKKNSIELILKTDLDKFSLTEATCVQFCVKGQKHDQAKFHKL